MLTIRIARPLRLARLVAVPAVAAVLLAGPAVASTQPEGGAGLAEPSARHAADLVAASEAQARIRVVPQSGETLPLSVIAPRTGLVLASEPRGGDVAGWPLAASILLATGGIMGLAAGLAALRP